MPGRQVVVRPDAEQTIKELAGPQVLIAAQALTQAIPDQVPVQSGSAQAMYRNSLRTEVQEDGSAAVTGFPPIWHWLEYGTRFNAAYRPIENAARSLGFTYEGKTA
jgi:hypothetical protein